MRWKSWLWAALLVTLGWLFLIGPGMWNRWRVHRAAGGYEERVLIVTGGICTGGETRRSRDGRTTTDARVCLLDGTVDGRAETLYVGSSLPEDRPAGTQVSIWYHPGMPATGINHESLRVREADDPPGTSLGWIRAAVTLPALSLVLLLLVNLAYRRPIATPTTTVGDSWLLLSGGHPGLGVPLLAVGLTLVLSQVRAVAWRGAVLGLLIAAPGGALLVRRFADLDRGRRRVRHGRELLGVRFGERVVDLASTPRIRCREGRGTAGVELLRPDAAPLLLEHATDAAAAAERADAIAAFLGTDSSVSAPARAPVSIDDDEADDDEADADGADDDDTPETSEAPRRRLPIGRITVGLFGAVVALALAVPSIREAALLALLDPAAPVIEARRFPALRRFAARRLADLGTDRAVEGLVRLLNTVDPDSQPEVAEAAAAALVSLAGSGPMPDAQLAEGNWLELTYRLNQWAAARVGRPLDENGGVLGWFPVDPRLAVHIDAIASDDLNQAWITWAGFGAGDIIDPEAFLFRVGAALGDHRPIHFAIKRGGFRSGNPPFEGQPEPIDQYRDEVIAETVGEALALRLWNYRGVGGEPFPEDFRAWWREYASSHRLPPARK